MWQPLGGLSLIFELNWIALLSFQLTASASSICHHCTVNGKRPISMYSGFGFVADSVCLFFFFFFVGSDKFKVGKSEEKKKWLQLCKLFLKNVFLGRRGVGIILDYFNLENQANPVQVWYLGWNLEIGFWILCGFSSNKWNIFLISFRKFWTFNFELSYPFMEQCYISGLFFFFFWNFWRCKQTRCFMICWNEEEMKWWWMNANIPFCFCNCCLFSCFWFSLETLYSQEFQLFSSWNVESNKSFYLMLLYL